MTRVIDNHSQRVYTIPVTAPLNLETLPRHQAATVDSIEWARLATPEARRLRELGFDTGVSIQVLHRARFGGGPIACRIGRMTVALRRAVAGAVRVSIDPLPAE